MDSETGGIPKDAIDFDAAKAKANFEAVRDKDFSKQPAEEAFKKVEQKEDDPRRLDEMQARVEAFASKYVTGYTDKGWKQGRGNVSYWLENARLIARIPDLQQLPDDLSEALRESLELYREKFKEYLKAPDEDEMEERVANIELYRQKFQKPIQGLKEKIAGTEDPRKLPEYLGSGTNATVYRLEVDGESYAARIGRGGDVFRDNYLKGKGLQHAVQLEAYSYEDSATVMELVPGRLISEMTPDTFSEYTDQEVIDLISTIVEMNQRGVRMDPKQTNTFYDKERGFTLIDYNLNNEGGPRSDLGYEMYYVIGIIGSGKVARLPYKRPAELDASEKDNLVQREVSKLESSLRLVGILKSHFPDLHKQLLDRLRMDREKDPPTYKKYSEYKFILEDQEVSRLDRELNRVIDEG